MTLVAIANALLDGVMRARFHAEPMVKATEMLLEERVPRSAPLVQPHSDEQMAPAHERERPWSTSRMSTRGGAGSRRT